MVELVHPPAAEALLPRLRPWARQIAARFGRPVYLVGSALRLPDPRDIDVRVVLTEAEFEARYGRVGSWWKPSPHDGSLRYAMDIGDLSREASLELRLNIDFQVQPLSEGRLFGGDGRLRLDDVSTLTDP